MTPKSRIADSMDPQDPRSDDTPSTAASVFRLTTEFGWVCYLFRLPKEDIMHLLSCPFYLIYELEQQVAGFNSDNTDCLP